MAETNKGKKVQTGQGSSGRPQKPRTRARRGGSRVPYIVAAVLLVAVICVVAVAYYQQYIAPFQQVIITFDDTQVKMKDFLDRAKLTGSGGMGTLQNITNEETVKAGMARAGITVTREEVDAALRKEAAGADNVTISDAEFKEWYRQLLGANKMSDAKFRETVKNRLLAQKAQDRVNAQIPASIEHAHVYGLFVTTYEEAAKVKERADAGEKFSDLVAELSIDQTRENGGELDWFPQGSMVNDRYDPFELKVGEVSSPLAVISDPNEAPAAYYVVTVTEFAVRQIQPEYLPVLQNKWYSDWLVQEQGQHSLHWNYNSEIDAWVNWQLNKGKSSTQSNTQSGS
jgi:parvulin-like peptidyl-prolyl isomerase